MTASTFHRILTRTTTLRSNLSESAN